MALVSENAVRKAPASRQDGWDEDAYQDHLHPDCIWWPWWVACEFLWRKTRHVMASTTLIPMANKCEMKGGKKLLMTFICGTKHRAPTRMTPVHRPSFMNWAQGGKPQDVTSWQNDISQPCKEAQG